MKVYYRMEGIKPQLGIFHNSVFSTLTEIDLRWNVYYLAAEFRLGEEPRNRYTSQMVIWKRKLMQRACSALIVLGNRSKCLMLLRSLFGGDNHLAPLLSHTDAPDSLQCIPPKCSESQVNCAGLPLAWSGIHRPVTTQTRVRALWGPPLGWPVQNWMHLAFWENHRQLQIRLFSLGRLYR